MVSVRYSDPTLERARQLVKEAKEVMKILYQLCFIATSDNPLNEDAKELIKEMIEKGYVSEDEVRKAISDVKRWRDLVLDKMGIRSIYEH